MSKEELKEFIKNTREKYKHIRYVECPAFGGEKIYFTKHGFNHLLRKGRIPRSMDEQIRRLKLLRYVVKIIEKNHAFESYRKAEKLNSILHFWSFKKVIAGKTIFVVICQRNDKPKTFLSIMDKN